MNTTANNRRHDFADTYPIRQVLNRPSNADPRKEAAQATAWRDMLIQQEKDHVHWRAMMRPPPQDEEPVTAAGYRIIAPLALAIAALLIISIRWWHI